MGAVVALGVAVVGRVSAWLVGETPSPFMTCFEETAMSSRTANNLTGLTPSECLRLLIEHRRKWLLPTIACGALALCYALVMSRYWEASQGLVVRRQASSSMSNEPGKFADLYEMRTFQETIFELVKSRQVISSTLKGVALAETGRDGGEPTASEIESFRKRVKMSPPGGAEFGKTEVFYLQAKDTNRDRAIRLVSELCKQLDARLGRLRSEQSQSLIGELNQQVEQAEAALQAETGLLAELELEVGPDLGELRMLNASFSGQSDLRQEAVNLNNERRAAEIRVREAKHLLRILNDAREEPDHLVAMPSSLLVSQPTLRRLKDGLVDAQLRAARLGGTRTSDHPQVLAANLAVENIRQDLHNELEVAIRGVEVESHLSKDRRANLEQQYQGVQQRLSRLAGLRVGYANRMAAVESSRIVLSQAQKQLGEVRSGQLTAHDVSLVTPIDRPETGPNPVGPGRASIVLLGTFGGFAFGMGWLFLTVVPGPVDSGEVAIPAAAATTATSTPRKVPSSLPPAVAAKVAEIIASRSAGMPVEAGI